MAARKVVSLLIAILAGSVSYQFPLLILAVPVIGCVFSLRLAESGHTYHELIGGMNRDLLFVVPLVSAAAGIALLMNDTRQLPTVAVFFAFAYYYCAYLDHLDALMFGSIARSLHIMIVCAAVFSLGLVSWRALDYAASLLDGSTWSSAGGEAKVHIISSILIYVLLAPVSGMLGAQLALLLTALARRLVGK